MIEPKEMYVQEISIADVAGEEKIDLHRFLENLHWSLPWDKRLDKIHLSIPDGSLTPENLRQLVNPAFGDFPPDATAIYHNDQIPTTEDLYFAEKFNLTVINHFACLALTPDGAIEAWISPVLLTEKHPLAKGGTVALFTKSRGESFQPTSSQNVRGFDDLVLGRYLRLTVTDQTQTLGQIGTILKDNVINIRQCQQPKPPEESPTAQIAFILDSCPGKTFNRAIEEIRALGIYKSIDANLPVITPDPE